MLLHGDAKGSVWRSAEVDVSIRPGWFYHPAEDEKVRSVANLIELYFSSVGRNGKLLLNVPPRREGLLHATDVERLARFRQRLNQGFERNLALGGLTAWRPYRGRAVSAGTTIGYSKLDVLAPTPMNRARLVLSYVVDEPEPITLRLYG